MIDGETGFMVRGRDVKALGAAMRALLDPALRAQMGAAARAFVEANQLEQPFAAILDSDAYRARLKRARHDDNVDTDPEPTVAAERVEDWLLDHRQDRPVGRSA
jgi:hypothetical protein